MKMAWTYTNNPAAVPRDAVRLLIGDTDTTDQKVTDEAIAFFLAEASDDVYGAAALSARSIAAKYATEVDSKFETVSANYSQLSKNYYELAKRLEQQAKKFGNNGLGVPVAGGIRVDDMNSVNQDSDRVMPKFNRDQFAWPRPGYRGDEIL
jgi:homoserine dehydrogenase